MSPSVNHHPDPYLTIVPEDSFIENDILETIVDVTEESDRLVEMPPMEEHFSMEPPPQREVAPRKTSKLVVAGALGGGMVFGGGVVAALSLVAVLAVGAAGIAGAGAWWWMGSESPVEAPVAAPIEEDLAPVADEDGVGEADEAAAAAEDGESEDGVGEDEEDLAAPVDAPEDRGHREAPAAPTPAPAAPPVVAPAVPTVAPEEIPADDILVKVLSNPPAATVTIDGVPAGRTPLKTFLPAGSHNVVIESGKASGEFTIDPSSSERFCFKAKGRKVQTDACR